MRRTHIPHIVFDEFVADTVKADVVDGGELELITSVNDVKTRSKVILLAITDRDDSVFFG